MKSPRHAVCGTQWARGLCVASAGGWPPSSSLSAALSHAFLFICLLNGFGFSPHSLLCKQTVWIRLPCRSPTHTARVGRSGRMGPAPAEARSCSHSLAAQGTGVPRPPQLPVLSSSHPAATSWVRDCTRAGGSAPGSGGACRPVAELPDSRSSLLETWAPQDSSQAQPAQGRADYPGII